MASIRSVSRSGIITGLACFVLTSPAFGQIEIQWITKDSATPKLVRGQSLAINKPTVVQVKVTGVNDFLYDHQIKTTLIPKIFNDAGTILGNLGGILSEAADGCKSVAGKIKKFEAGYTAATKDADKKYIPLETMQASLKDVQDALADMTADSEYKKDDICRPKPKKQADTLIDAKITQFNASPHFVSASATVEPAFDLQIDVTASTLDTRKPLGTTYTVTVGIVTNQLSLSLGVMATELQARTYSSRNSVVGGALSANHLVVDNRGIRPIGVALLNYSLFGFGRSTAQDHFGLSLSAGPTVGLGKSGDPSMGFFGGVTFRLWDRFFITPGAHIGQFADFPAGLVNNDVIPDKYGALTPVNRWSTRFGIAFTFRTNDFSAVKKATSTTDNTKADAKAKKPASGGAANQ